MFFSERAVSPTVLSSQLLISAGGQHPAPPARRRLGRHPAPQPGRPGLLGAARRRARPGPGRRGPSPVVPCKDGPHDRPNRARRRGEEKAACGERSCDGEGESRCVEGDYGQSEGHAGLQVEGDSQPGNGLGEDDWRDLDEGLIALPASEAS